MKKSERTHSGFKAAELRDKDNNSRADADEARQSRNSFGSLGLDHDTMVSKHDGKLCLDDATKDKQSGGKGQMRKD